jgi:hypothetical protein
LINNLNLCGSAPEANIASGRAEETICFSKTFAQRANVLEKREQSTLLPQAKCAVNEMKLLV